VHASRFGHFLIFGRPDASVPQLVPAQRDLRIDIIRGLALLIIFINHMPGHVLAGFTPHNFGFSDAADAFVLLAGISATLAYGGLIERKGLRAGSLKILSRLRTLYLAHLAVFLLVCAIVATAVTRTQNPLYFEALNVQPFFADLTQGVLRALALSYQPNFLDILPLYIVLLALLPVLYLAVRFSPALALAVSAALWQTASLTGLNLPNAAGAGWYFNPFAWQFLFCLGIVIGRMAQLGLSAPSLRGLDLLAAGFVVFALLVKTASGNPLGIAALDDWIFHIQIGADKTNLGAGRVLHVMALAWLLIRLLPRDTGILRLQALKPLAAMGRHSLEIFCVGTVLSIIGQIVLVETSHALGPQLLVAALGGIILLGLGMFLTWYQSFKRRAPAGSAPASGLPAQLS